MMAMPRLLSFAKCCHAARADYAMLLITLFTSSHVTTLLLAHAVLLLITLLPLAVSLLLLLFIADYAAAVCC